MRTYHEQQFWADVRRLPVTVAAHDHMSETYRGLGFFDTLAGAPIAEAHRLLFAVCFYFETLIDQGLHYHFPASHERFQLVRPLPKFGTLGMGPHISPPARFLKIADDHWALPRNELAELLAGGGEYFPKWAKRFFAKERVGVDAAELFGALGTQNLGDLGNVRWSGV